MATRIVLATFGAEHSLSLDADEPPRALLSRVAVWPHEEVRT
jgi:hypothetical protein